MKHSPPKRERTGGLHRPTICRVHVILAVLALGVAAGVGGSAGQEQPGAFLEFVRGRAEVLRADDSPPATLAEWEVRRVALRDRLVEALGGFPGEACPLEPEVLGVLDRDGYRVEKVVFSTMPGVRMTANAYVPDGPGPFPAVLCVHGHWRGAKQDPTVQARCIGLARLGFLALVVDAFGAGERGIGKALGEYHGEMVAATLIPTGRMLAGIQAWENRRAVDYLQSRPEVDAGRIGVTGASGGGNQTMYAGALDERLAAVVPTCSVGNYRSYLGVACCLCEVVPGALEFTEEWGVLGLVAPRALMVSNATRDSVQFSVAEAGKSIAGAAPVFALQEASSRLRHAVFESPHDYNREMREAMYGWMTRHLKGEGDGGAVPEPAIETEDPEVLRCYPGGDRPDDWLTLPQFAAREGRRLVEAVGVPDSADDWRRHKELLRAALAAKLGWTERSETGSTPDGVVVESGPDGDELLAIETEPGIRLRARRVRPGADASGEGELAILLAGDGVAASAESSLAGALADRGWTVISAGLRAVGENAPERDRIGRAPDHNTAEWSLWIGRPLLGQWVADVRAWLDALAIGEDRRVTVIGRGPDGVVALAAAALDDRIDRVATVGTLASFISDVPYENQRLGILVPGMLRDVGDVSHLAALCSPRPLVVAGGVHGGGRSLGADELAEQFAFTRAAFEYDDGALDVVADTDAGSLARRLSSAGN